MAGSDEIQVARNDKSTEVLTAFNVIPYALINDEVNGSAKETLDELTEICSFYKIYKKGADFTVEGSNGDYIPASLKYKMAASLVNKEARFLFAEPPDIVVEAKGDVGKITEESKESIAALNDLVKTILLKNKFEDALLKATKDCFIGKRVACLVNFNEEDGVVLTFFPSTQFIYETKMGNPNIITKFVCFLVVKDSRTLNDKRIFKKKYEVIDDVVYLEEALYDGVGRKIEDTFERQPVLLDSIPVSIIINDGLTGEIQGESEVDLLKSYEIWYSKLSNADKDAERKSMNPTKYLVDMDSNSTASLSTGAGALWDLGSDQNLDHASPKVGILESSMNYSAALKTTLDRVKTTGYEQVDMPNITLESMQGSITSGKSLKAIYWPLIVRCKEKMKTWGPQLRQIVEIIISGSMKYPGCITRYTNSILSPVDYEISIVQNTPLPEDENEEKQIDLEEVDAKVMSRATYMKKWRGLSDEQIKEELIQIAKERAIIEDSVFNDSEEDKPPYEEE